MAEDGSLSVEPLAARDVAAVAALSARCFTTPWTCEELADEIARHVSRVLVAGIDGSPVGYGVAYVIAGESEVLTIGVDPDHRREGIGAALLSRLLRGCARAHLEVRADNAAARALYERLGFARAGVRRGYYADGTDALLMEWVRPSSP